MGQDIRIKPGSVVQVNENGKEWAGCTLIVSELKSFGVQAYLKVPFKGNAYMRLTWEQIEYIGEAVLIAGDD